ncbi:MAG: HD domain-containing protein [Planctomycetota bacterium]
MPYSPRFDDALVFASELHREQTRKGSGIPYVNHLLGVAAIVGEAGGTEDQVIAALLHDAVEDQGGLDTLEEIRARFGAAVADMVMSCTDTVEDPKPAWRPRKEAYVAHVATADEDALLVSIADKLYNTRTILMALRTEGESVWDRFTGKRDGSLWYYRALVDAFRARGGRADLVLELDRTVTSLEETVVE